MSRKKKQAERQESTTFIVAEDQALEPVEPTPQVARFDNNSLAGRWAFEGWSVLRELWRTRVRMITYYMKPEGGNLDMEEAIKRATEQSGEAITEEVVENILQRSVDGISWFILDELFSKDPGLGQRLWEDIKEQALLDFKSGHYAAAMFESTDWQKNPWKRAHFVAIYEEMVADYKPRGAIEHSMVEMVAVHYFLWQHWVTEHLKRATTDPREESRDYAEWRAGRKRTYFRNGEHFKGEYSGQYFEGAWDLPYQREADAIDHAAQLAEKFRRAYHASIRNLRDWRRYPVTIHNQGQVNIGGQQVNVQTGK